MFGLLAVLVCVAPVLIDFSGSLFDYAATLKLIWIESGALLLLLFWARLRGGQRVKVRKDFLLISLLVFCAWCALSLVWARSRQDTAGALVLWLACLVFYFVIVNMPDDQWDGWKLGHWVLAAAAVVSLIGLAQACYAFNWIYQSRSPASTFGNKNLAAEYLTFAFPLLVFSILKANRRRTLLLTSSALALVVNYVWLNRAKAVWLALALEVGVLALILLIDRFRFGRLPFDHFWKKAAVALSVLVLTFVLIDVTMVQQPGQETVSQMISRTLRSAVSDPNRPVTGSQQAPDLLKPEQQDSLSVRTAVWRNTLTMVKERPIFGFGFGNFKVFYPKYSHRVVYDSKVSATEHWEGPHNDYLQIAVETGIIGLLFFGCVVFAFFRVSWLQIRRGAQSDTRYLAIGCFVALVGTSVNLFFSFPLQTAVSPLMIAVFLGVLAREANSKDPQATDRFLTLPVTGRHLALVVLILLLFSGRLAIDRLAADYDMAKVFRGQDQRMWPTVVLEGKRTLEYFPDWHEPHQTMSRAYLEMNDPGSAIKETEAVLKSRPYYVNALYNRGAAHLLLGEQEKAALFLKQSVELVPGYAEAHHALARLYLDEKRFQEAAREAQLAIKYGPDNPQHYYGLSLAYFNQGQFQKAVDSLKPALRLDPNNAQFYYHLARAFMGMGHLEEARTNAERAEQLRPEWNLAKALAGRLRQLTAGEIKRGS